MAVARVIHVSTGRFKVSEEPAKPDESAESTADPLRLVLHTMEEQLDDRVGAVSGTGPSSRESTSDLIRLEETLSSAQDKAKQLVTLRLKLDGETSTADPSAVNPADPVSAAGADAARAMPSAPLADRAQEPGGESHDPGSRPSRPRESEHPSPDPSLHA